MSKTSTLHQNPLPSQYLKTVLAQIGITNPEAVTTKQASQYLSIIKGIPTASSTLEVYRCTGRGPIYKKVGSRCFYTIAWLDKYADGVEVKIFDPSKANKKVA